MAIGTTTWIQIGLPASKPIFVYSIFRRCDTITDGEQSVTECKKVTTFELIQGLEIAGVVILGVGVIIGVALKVLQPPAKLQLLAPFLPMLGSILILLGSLLYAKYVIEHFVEFTLEITVGYSMILMAIACIFGFLATVHFAFNAGLAFGAHRTTVNVQ